MRDITQFLALMAGGYLAVTGLGLLVSTRFYSEAADVQTDGVTLNLSGAVHFLVGLAVLIRHPFLDGPVAAGVTLVGAAAALKGAMLIVLPGLSTRTAQSGPGLIRLSGVVFAALGLAFLAAALRAGL